MKTDGRKLMKYTFLPKKESGGWDEKNSILRESGYRLRIDAPMWARISEGRVEAG
jgi:hypothetical protein